jgi:hypothetical protein
MSNEIFLLKITVNFSKKQVRKTKHNCVAEIERMD